MGAKTDQANTAVGRQIMRSLCVGGMIACVWQVWVGGTAGVSLGWFGLCAVLWYAFR